MKHNRITKKMRTASSEATSAATTENYRHGEKHMNTAAQETPCKKNRRPRLFCFALCLLLFAALLGGCAPAEDPKKDETTDVNPPEDNPPADPKDPADEDPPEEPKAPENALLLFDGKTYTFSIVREDALSGGTCTEIRTMQNKIRVVCGSRSAPALMTDATEEGEFPELLVGATNRARSDAVADALGIVFCYRIEVSADGITIFGTDSEETEKGVIAFYSDYLEKNTVTVGDRVYLSYGGMTGEERTPLLGDLAAIAAKRGLSVGCTSEKVFEMGKVADYYTVLQGACSDPTGRYLYIGAYRSKKSVLVKYDLQTGEQLAINLESGTDHANDMCYYPKQDAIAVVHNTPNGEIISFFRADTLEKISDKNLGFVTYSIAYIPGTENEFFVGVSGGTDDFRRVKLLAETDEEGLDFHVLRSFRQKATGFVHQGIDCDEKYIYFVQSGDNLGGNSVIVYDYNGTRVNILHIPGIRSEIENMFHVGKKLYMGFYTSPGGRVFTFTFTVGEETEG